MRQADFSEAPVPPADRFRRLAPMRSGGSASSVAGVSATSDTRAREQVPGRPPDANDPGLLTPAQTSLLTDQYELAMASSYLGRGMNEPAVFELFVRHLPPRRRWLLAAGLGPAVALVREMEFGEGELEYVRSLGFGSAFLEYLARFR